jgi:nitronate monooxygenase
MNKPWPSLHIGDIEVPHPIVQGGMGVRISIHRLASTVSRAGGIGTIASAAIGLEEPDAFQDLSQADKRALKEELKKAQQLAEGKPIAVNIMVAQTDYKNLVEIAIEGGADIILSGAGLPMSLPRIAHGAPTKLVPIISSARAGVLIFRNWVKKYNRRPDAFVIEGAKAGGHLGFKYEELVKDTYTPLLTILRETREALKPLEQGEPIPLIVAGGIFYGWEIRKALEVGAQGVQMATRFVATQECDAARSFKEAYIKAKEEDVIIIQSPVGMPGRALRNPFVEAILRGEKRPIICPYHCLKPCDPHNSPYCIALALLLAKKGDVKRGLIFAGTRVAEVKGITTVPSLFQDLMEEYQSGPNLPSPPE